MVQDREYKIRRKFQVLQITVGLGLLYNMKYSLHQKFAVFIFEHFIFHWHLMCAVFPGLNVRCIYKKILILVHLIFTN